MEPQTLAQAMLDAARRNQQRQLSETDSYRLLEPFGISAASWRAADSPHAAAKAAADLGYPVVVKGVSATIGHKTEHGLVRLNLTSEAAVRDSAAALLKMPEVSGVLVQRQLNNSRELLAGMVRDKSFGPCVLLGLGGLAAEALAQRVVRLAPFDRREALAMIAECPGQKLFGDFRGQPAVDRERLAALLTGLGEAAATLPEIGEIDLNPILVDGAAPLAADALVTLTDRGT